MGLVISRIMQKFPAYDLDKIGNLPRVTVLFLNELINAQIEKENEAREE